MSGIFSKQIFTASILISSIVLTACGDGGSGTANNPPVAVNEAPVANNDSYNSVSQGGALTVTSANGALTNDSDLENDTLD